MHIVWTVGIVAGVLALYAVIWYAGFALLERRRTRALAKACRQLNFAFNPGPVKDKIDPLQGLYLCQMGRSGKACNVMQGTMDGQEVLLLDFHLNIGRGMRPVIAKQTLVILPGTGLPDFLVMPGRTKSAFAQFMSKDSYPCPDLTIPDHEAFNRRCRLRGRDEPALRAAFSRKVLDHLGASHDRKGGFIQAYRGNLVVYRGGHKCKPSECGQKVIEALHLLRLLTGASHIPPGAFTNPASDHERSTMDGGSPVPRHRSLTEQVFWLVLLSAVCIVAGAWIVYGGYQLASSAELRSVYQVGPGEWRIQLSSRVKAEQYSLIMGILLCVAGAALALGGPGTLIARFVRQRQARVETTATEQRQPEPSLHAYALQVLLSSAAQAEDRGDYETAIQKYQTIIARSGNNPVNAHLARGRIAQLESKLQGRRAGPNASAD